MTRTIEYIPIEDLKENPRNVKDHEIPTVTASISRFGVIAPIVVADEAARTAFAKNIKTVLEKNKLTVS